MLWCSLETLASILLWWSLRGLKGALNSTSMIPRVASLSDSIAPNSVQVWTGSISAYTQRNISQILSNRTQIRMYSPYFLDWFGTANGQRPFAVPNQTLHCKYNLIWVWFDLIWFMSRRHVSHSDGSWWELLITIIVNAPKELMFEKMTSCLPLQ